MRTGIFFVSLTLVGCATQRTAMIAPRQTPAEEPIVRLAPSTHRVETRYDIRSYRDPNDPAVRHEAHAVYRLTRVPARVESLETIPREDFAPVTYAPLPASAELSAELAMQRQLTAELREIKTHMAAVEQQAQGQYRTLVNQTSDTLRLREQLEAERANAREREAKSQVGAGDSTGTPAATTAAADPKW